MERKRESLGLFFLEIKQRGKVERVGEVVNTEVVQQPKSLFLLNNNYHDNILE